MITIPVNGELQIRSDGKVIWLNTENGCILRICGITTINPNDLKKLEKDSSLLKFVDITVKEGVSSVNLDT